jgi:transcriptional regulator
MAYVKNQSKNVVAVPDERVEDLKKQGFVLTDAEGNELEVATKSEDLEALKKDLETANKKVAALEKQLAEQSEKASKDLELANKKVTELEKAAKK